jgi:uncharacterized DUF497 family protein
MDERDKKILKKCTGFDWDTSNIDKNWLKHRVSPAECEQVFFNRPLIIQDDFAHSHVERRFYGLGKTDSKRTLFVVFTIRNNLIRIISARDMSSKERKVYDNG